MMNRRVFISILGVGLVGTTVVQDSIFIDIPVAAKAGLSLETIDAILRVHYLEPIRAHLDNSSILLRYLEEHS